VGPEGDCIADSSPCIAPVPRGRPQGPLDPPVWGRSAMTPDRRVGNVVAMSTVPADVLGVHALIRWRARVGTARHSSLNRRETTRPYCTTERD
jgi:hypothetical protein